MKLKNKRTGEIGTPRVNYQELYVDTENGYTYNYKSLQKMCEEWEDVPEEPKGHWYLNYMGDVLHTEFESINPEKKIGNYFETKEEAEKAVEKLKAWKRLKDKGIKFKKEMFYGGHEYSITACYDDDYAEDLDLLFGGEE